MTEIYDIHANGFNNRTQYNTNSLIASLTLLS